jgi:hypothetical protein
MGSSRSLATLDRTTTTISAPPSEDIHPSFIFDPNVVEDARSDLRPNEDPLSVASIELATLGTIPAIPPNYRTGADRYIALNNYDKEGIELTAPKIMLNPQVVSSVVTSLANDPNITNINELLNDLSGKLNQVGGVELCRAIIPLVGTPEFNQIFRGLSAENKDIIINALETIKDSPYTGIPIPRQLVNIEVYSWFIR